MRKQYLNLVIILVALSLIGLVFTQTFWLKRLVETAEEQYDDRSDRMMNDVMRELMNYADTSQHIKNISHEDLEIFDVVDTALLTGLIQKYINYHRLDSTYEYAIVRSSDKSIMFASVNYTPDYEEEAYKDCFSCLWQKEYVHLSVFFPNKKKTIYTEMTSWIMLSVVFLIVITIAFVYVIYSIIRQKKLSEIKNDFINNMTHEFKTPISTISLASEMLLKGSKSIKKYSQIIIDENKRMQSQVELVLQTALIDKGGIKLKLENVDLNELVLNTVESFSLDECEQDPIFDYDLEAKKTSVSVDVTHIRNVISNIIDNAIKYSNGSGTPSIKLATKNILNGLQLAISDNGIGISKEAQKKIFDKFYRVSTGNIHNVKGFGLGLYYVKTIVEAHHGEISVNSSANNGSTFYVYLPQ